MNAIVDRIIKLRKRKGWTQAQAAKEIGVKVRTLRAWEQGKRTPSGLVAWAVASFISQQ